VLSLRACPAHFLTYTTPYPSEPNQEHYHGETHSQPIRIGSRGLKKGITKPAAVIDHIQKEHGVAVKPGLIHNIKSIEKNKKPTAKPGRKPAKVQASSNGVVSISLQDITTVKGLLIRLGQNGVRDLVSVLS
jgi:hypothetical protein